MPLNCIEQSILGEAGMVTQLLPNKYSGRYVALVSRLSPFAFRYLRYNDLV